MWRWLKLLTGWLMRDWLAHISSLPLGVAPQVRSLRIGWKKHGLEFEGTPVLATADEIIVRAELRYSANKSARKSDLVLRTSQRCYFPDTLLQDGFASGQGLHRAEFHLDPLAANDTLELCWQGHSLYQAAVPVLSLRQFVEQLRLFHPTLFVVLGTSTEAPEYAECTVPCSKYLRLQGRSLLASVEFVSPTPLVGLVDCQPTLIFREESSGQAWEIPIRFTADQLRARQALVTVPCPVRPRRAGRWTIEWCLLRDALARCQLEVRPMTRSSHRYINLVDAYFVWYEKETNQVRIERRLPKQLGPGRLGPCFQLCSNEPGLAFLANVEVYAVCQGGLAPRLLASEEILITDVPTTYVPGTISVHDLQQVISFELRCGRHLLGHLPLSPIPSAKINSEGAFEGVPDDLTWSPAFEEELRERLNRLMDSH